MTQTNPGQRRTALLGLALDAPAPPGKRPDLAEIHAWQQGQLTEPRASEVKAHVARDPECYQLWHQLQARTPPAPWLWPWRHRWSLRWPHFQPMPWLGGGLATAMMVLLMVQWLQPISPIAYTEQAYGDWQGAPPPLSTWPLQHSQTSKSLYFEPAQQRDFAQRAFRAGMLQGLQQLVGDQADWQNALADLDDLNPCPAALAAGICETQKKQLNALGRWAVLAYAHCQTGLSDTQGLALWQKSLHTQSHAIAEFVRNWPPQVPFCTQLNQFIGS